MEYMGRSVSRIYVALDNKKEEFKSHMIEVEGMINNQTYCLWVHMNCLIGMDWLDQHHAILDFHNKEFTFLDEERNSRVVQGIPRTVIVREDISNAAEEVL
jgi:hypothetical protein